MDPLFHKKEKVQMSLHWHLCALVTVDYCLKKSLPSVLLGSLFILSGHLISPMASGNQLCS